MPNTSNYKNVPVQFRTSNKSNESPSPEVRQAKTETIEIKRINVRKGRSNLPRLLCFCRLEPTLYTVEELETQIQQLHKFCLIHFQDSYRVHLNRLKGLKLLETMIKKTNFAVVLPIHMMSLIWCIVSCIHHFYIRLRARNGILDWSRRYHSKRSMMVYKSLITLISPDLYPYVVHAIITFYSESKMWNTEFLCAQLLKELLYTEYESEDTVHAILDVAEKWSSSNIRDARQVIRVLYQVLENYPWETMDFSLLARLLSMFYQSIIPESPSNFDLTPIRKGLEVCLRHVMQNLPNESLLEIIKEMILWTLDERMTNEALLDFGNLLEYAASLHETYLYRDTFKSDLLPLILKLVASQNGIHSLLGNRVLQFMMDRHSNRINFDTPRIYFDNMNYSVIVSQYNSEDKSFIRKYRETIHSSLLASIQMHGVHRINLESTYASIAIIVVEIPCGYTAAAVVCLAMAIQEYTISDDTLELECSHRLHATVMAIMSLVCWVHSAQIFYEYLNTVLSRRAQFAPHLNPPFKTGYQYAQHHILWNKPELFFEDWEARYGLWKCFRTKKVKSDGFLPIKVDSEHEARHLI